MTLALRWLSMRYATGLRRAMSAWTPLVIALVAAIGMEVPINFRAAARAWNASTATTQILYVIAVSTVIVIASRRVLRPALRGEGSELLRALPIAARTRFALDVLATLLFLLPAIIVATIIIGALAIPIAVANTTLIVPGQRQTANRQRRPAPYELHWFLSRRILGAIAGSLLCIGAAKLAIVNNDVRGAAAIARVSSLFACIAAMIVSLETGRRDAESRPFRLIERTLPRTARTSLLRTTAIATIFIVPAAILAPSPIATFVALVACAMLFLLARHESEGAVGWAGSFAALFAALQPVVVLAAMIIAIIVLVRSLEARERTSDA
ncbi:MAG TPA: hypothetical protein VN181_12980 [Thermoanaerobaculia bacterium]|nr:hypothetical protein [Thermoanaerobaculia bacterium]